MQPDIANYHQQLSEEEQHICLALCTLIETHLPQAEAKVWHAHPVWFIADNPVVGYSKLKSGIRLLFWSGQSFDEPKLIAEGKFKAADIRYTNINQLNENDIKRWLHKALAIQWDYKNIVKRKGVLLPLTTF